LPKEISEYAKRCSQREQRYLEITFGRRSVQAAQRGKIKIALDCLVIHSGSFSNMGGEFVSEREASSGNISLKVRKGWKGI